MYAITGMPVGVFNAQVAERDPQGQYCSNSSTVFRLKPANSGTAGDMNNKYQMGVSTNLKYKGISLGIDFDIRQGGVMYSRTKDINYFTGNAIQTAYNDRNPLIVPNSVNKIVNGENVTYVENTTPITSSNIYKYWGRRWL